MHLARCFVAEACVGDLVGEFVELFGAVIALAEFALDGLQLLTQVVLTLRSAQFGINLALNLAREFEHADFARENVEQDPKTLHHVERLEHSLLVLDAEGHVRCDEVGHHIRLLDGLGERAQLVWEMRGQSDGLVEHRRDRSAECLSFFDAVLGDRLILEDFDASSQIGSFLEPFNNAESRDALDDQPGGVGHFDERADDDCASDIEDIIKSGRVEVCLLLGDNPDDAVVADDRVIDQLNAGFAADAERRDEHRVDDRVPQGQQVQLRRNLKRNLVVVARHLDGRRLKVVHLGDDFHGVFGFGSGFGAFRSCQGSTLS